MEFSAPFLINIIHQKCNDCANHSYVNRKNCPDKKCALYPARLKPAQIDLFAGEYKRIWLQETEEIAETMITPFWFSDLRLRCKIAPAHSSWWGALTKKMQTAGFYQTGRGRNSPIPSLKGSRESEWTR